MTKKPIRARYPSDDGYIQIGKMGYITYSNCNVSEQILKQTAALSRLLVAENKIEPKLPGQIWRDNIGDELVVLEGGYCRYFDDDTRTLIKIDDNYSDLWTK